MICWKGSRWRARQYGQDHRTGAGLLTSRLSSGERIQFTLLKLLSFGVSCHPTCNPSRGCHVQRQLWSGRTTRVSVPHCHESTQGHSWRYLNRSSCEARKLLDVLPLLADDGADGERWDKQVNGLRFWRLLERQHRHATLVQTRLLPLAQEWGVLKQQEYEEVDKSLPNVEKISWSTQKHWI